MRFQTIPLRFRVWDDTEKKWGAIPSHQIGIGLDLLHGDANQEDSRYIISQDTGLKDKNGESIYTGDIIYNPAVELHGYVYYLESEASLMVRYEDGDVDYLTPRVGEPAVIKKGNIWQDGERLLYQKE